jgi:hypothetical protein
VRLHGADAEDQLLGDLRIDVAEREQSEDLDLARGQLVGWSLGLVRLGGEPGAQLRVDVGPAGDDRVDRGDELTGG